MAIEIYKTKHKIGPTFLNDIFQRRVYEGTELRSNTDFLLPEIRSVHYGNPPPQTPISQFRRYYQQTYCYKSTHSIVTYLYSIQRLLHCNLSDIKERMMHS